MQTNNNIYINFSNKQVQQIKLFLKKFQNVVCKFFPYNNPKYLNLTFMQNPKEKYGKYDRNTVKPTFYNILRYIYLDIHN